MITLYQHQKEGRDFLLSHKKACLFFEVGTGKTYTALSAITSLPKGKVLIVAPKRVLDMVWKSDSNYDMSMYDVTYINYEKVSRDQEFSKKTWDYIILDEVHKLKGKTTKVSRKFRSVCSRAKYVFGLTGTPIANNYIDIYNIYKNMGISEFNETYDEFVNKYYYTKSMRGTFGFNFYLPICIKNFMLSELLSRINKHSMVKQAKDCVDLPDKRTNIIKIKGMNTDKYKEIFKGILKTDYYEKTMIPLESINKSRQASNGYFYDDFGNVVNFTDNKKLKYLDSLLEDMLEETDKVIIVYFYKEDLRQLKTLQYDYTEDPLEFPDKQILFLQFGQAEGLNLQYCNNMIYYTYDYSFLYYEQMCGRIYRNGQKNTVTYTVLINENTIEEKVWWAIQNKKNIDEFLKEALNG